MRFTLQYKTLFNKFKFGRKICYLFYFNDYLLIGLLFTTNATFLEGIVDSEKVINKNQRFCPISSEPRHE